MALIVMSPPEVAQGIVRMTVVDDDTALAMALELDEARFQAASKDLARVLAVTERHEAEMVRASFDALSSTFAFQYHLASHSGHAWRASAQASRASIPAHIFGWLSSTRLFLDHSRQLLSREFGKTSPEFKRFEEATHWVYDHSISYRFLDQLRNAFQHAGMPPFSVSGVLSEATGEMELHLVADRERLLAFYTWKKVVRDDLSAMDELINVYDLLVGGVAQFEFLATQVRELLRGAAIEPAGRLTALVAEVPGPRSGLYLARFRRSGDSSPDATSMKMELRPLDSPVMAAIARMPTIDGLPDHVLPCIGTLAEDAVILGICDQQSSTLVTIPHEAGIGFLAVCDLHQRSVARWAVRHLGAAGLIHPAIMDYMIAGLAAAGHMASPVTSVVALFGLRRVQGPLPMMGLDITASGWKVSQHPEVLVRTRRAIEAMALWASEGGGTAAFFSGIDAMVGEDDSVEPLLTGLVNLSETLLQMVASLHGRSAESVLGSLGQEIVDAHLAPARSEDEGPQE